MNTAPAGRLGRKPYHSWTSGLFAGEFAKLPSFLAGRSRKHWIATESRECSYTRRGAHWRPLALPWEKEGTEGNEASSCTQAHHLLFRSWPPRRWVNEADHECWKREKERIPVKFLTLLQFLAKIWLLRYWKQEPPSGTAAAVSGLPADRTMVICVPVKGAYAWKTASVSMSYKIKGSHFAWLVVRSADPLWRQKKNCLKANCGWIVQPFEKAQKNWHLSSWKEWTCFLAEGFYKL